VDDARRDGATPRSGATYSEQRTEEVVKEMRLIAWAEREDTVFVALGGGMKG
jgi:hypothetical protein